MIGMDVNIVFAEHSSLWGDVPAGEAGYIDSSIYDLSEKLSLAVLNVDGSSFFFFPQLPQLGSVAAVAAVAAVTHNQRASLLINSYFLFFFIK